MPNGEISPGEVWRLLGRVEHAVANIETAVEKLAIAFSRADERIRQLESSRTMELRIVGALGLAGLSGLIAGVWRLLVR